MRICLLSTSLLKVPPLFGGAIETFTYELGMGLAKLNNQVLIISRNEISHISKIKSNLTINYLKIPNNSFIRGLFYNFKIIRLLLKLKPIEILHLQGTSVFPSAYFVSKRLRIPIVITEHVYHPWISIPISTLLKRIKYPFERFLGKFSLINSEKIIVANEYMKKSIQNIYPMMNTKFAIVPQGINQEMFNLKLDRTYLRKKYNLSDTDKIILYVGRIIPEKNIEILIKTFYQLKKQYNNIKLLLVGPKEPRFPTYKSKKSSKYYLKLKELIQKKNFHKSIIITDSIPYKKIPLYYAGCNLFVQPSVIETFGRAIFEAAAVGIPFICSQIGNKIPNYLPKYSSIFLKDINITQLQAAIKKILDNEAEFKKNGKKAAEFIHRHYNWLEIAKKYLIIYKDVIKKLEG